MKKQVTWIGLLLCLLLFAACEKPVLDNGEDGKKANNAKQKLTRVVRIHPKELHIETIEETIGAKYQPLSRAVSEDRKRKFYAVNVYEKKPNDETYSMYAYGLFTSLSKIALKMNVNNLYKVECLIVEEGDDELFANEDEFSAPFLHGTKKGTKVTNSFVFSKEENLNSLTKGETTVAKGRTAQYPRLVKLYGTVNDFSPKTSKELTIDMKRSVFGLHFKVTPPEEGSLVINYIGWRISLTKGSNEYDHSSVYSFSNIPKACEDGYQLTMEVKVTWTKDNGTVEQESKQLVLKRNVMTVVEIRVEGQKPQGFTLNEEPNDMKTEKVEWNLLL